MYWLTVCFSLYVLFARASATAVTDQQTSQLLGICRNASAFVLRQQEDRILRLLEEDKAMQEEANRCNIKQSFNGARQNKPRDCQEILSCDPSAPSWVYTIYPENYPEGFPVFCDMANGGWITIQRRENGLVDFYRDWNEYKMGFGNNTGEFWLGLNKIYAIVHQSRYQLRVDLHNINHNAQYRRFSIGSEKDEYILAVSGYSGTAGDKLARHNGMKFTTKDRDNDLYHRNCAQVYHGAWWYEKCYDSNLNGLYSSKIVWNGSQKFVEMKIRREG